jgi:putative effector of murein hydrolase LrgA (UPF0299 family)
MEFDNASKSKRKALGRFAGLLQGGLMILFAPVAYLVSKHWNVSDYTACIVAIVAATVITSIAVEVVARKRRREDK